LSLLPAPIKGPVVPKLHLSKVAFACRDTDSLAARIASRAIDGELRVATRMRPRRADELIGGCLYWIVKHRLVGCNRILRIEDRQDGRIDIVCSPELQRVTPAHRRAHQGWRYLEDGDAPTAEGDGTGIAGLPPRLYGRLAALALV
jgi:hypothetical protein